MPNFCKPVKKPAFNRPSIFAIFLSLCPGVWVPAWAQEETFRSANADFSNGKFAEAIAGYQEIVEGETMSPELFYNLGTALYRSGKKGEGILWYRRAEVLAPHMPEVRQSMEFLRSQSGFLEFRAGKIDSTVRAIPHLVYRWVYSLGGWCLGFALIGIFFVRRLRRFRGMLITTAVLSLLIGSGVYWLSQYRAKNLAGENFATVVAPDTIARTSPTDDSGKVIDLPAGSEIRVIQKAGAWIYAEIPSDIRAWLRGETVESVWPIPGLGR